jgi:hypothetical protein
MHVWVDEARHHGEPPNITNVIPNLGKIGTDAEDQVANKSNVGDASAMAQSVDDYPPS